MINSSENLKKKIDIFRSKFLSKKEIIKFEENQVDKIIGIVLDGIIKVSLPIIRVIFNSIMKITNKFLDFISQQNELKIKVSKQEEILLINTKLNKELSLQIKELHNKIDSLNEDSKISTPVIEDKKTENQIIIHKNIKDSKSEKNSEIRFFQDENLRISNELYETKTKFEIIKKEMEKFQEQRSNLINKINSINEAVEDTNVVTSVFDNNHGQKKIKIHNFDIKKQNLDLDLDNEIKNIFAKSK
jgi:hypothetical protein